MKKIIGIISLILILIIHLTGCDDFQKYLGEHPDLHVIATNSLLGVLGHQGDDIQILEEDHYGRKLFSFLGGTTNSENYILAVLISQKTTKTDSYFYDNINFIICELDNYTKVDKDTILQYFTSEQIEVLKQINDWDKETGSQKLFKVHITRKKIDKIPIRIQRKAFEKVSNDYHATYSVPLTTDASGKTLYYMRGMKYDDKTREYFFTKSYLLMFDKNQKIIEGTGIMEITDLWNYQQKLKEFKVINNWDY
jgi:hypothetical protein